MDRRTFVHSVVGAGMLRLLPAGGEVDDKPEHIVEEDGGAAVVICGCEVVPITTLDKSPICYRYYYVCPITKQEDCPMCSGEYCYHHFDKPCGCSIETRHGPPLTLNVFDFVENS